MVVQVRELNRLTHRHSVCHAQNVEIRDGIVTVLQRNYIVPYLAFIISGQNFSFKTGIVDSEIISSPVPAVSAACGFAVCRRRVLERRQFSGILVLEIRPERQGQRV